MSGIYASYPPGASGSNTEIPKYPTMGDFPNPTSVPNGTFAFALDTDTLYVSNGAAWEVIGGPGVPLAIGTIDSGVASANGAHIDSNELIMQSASATVPGLVNTTTQTLAGDKTFTGSISAANLSGTNTGDVSLTAVGSSPNANAASLAGQALTLQPADGTNPGVLTASAQTIGGNKTFSGSISASNFSGSSSGTNTGDVTLAAVGSAPNSDGASLSGQQITLQPADGSNPGLVSTTTQTLAGNKTILGQVNVQSGVVPSMLIGANNNSTTITDSTNKFARVAMPHYLSSSEEPFCMMASSTQTTSSEIFIGGGSTTLNAATTLRLYTAADNTTLLGTERLTIDSSGLIYVRSLTTNGVVYTSSGVGILNSEQYLDRTRGGTGITSTATFPSTASDTASSFVMKAGTETISGAKTFSAAVTLNVSGASMLYSQNDTRIVADTADGADTRAIAICGGGSISTARGGFISMFGNEHATVPGGITLTPGGSGNVVVDSNLLISNNGIKVKASGAGSDTISWASSPTSASAPVMSGATVAGSFTGGSPTLVWSRIGPLVFFTAFANWTNTSGSPSGHLRMTLTGLPNSASGGYSNFQCEMNNIVLPASAVDINAQLGPSSNILTFAVNRDSSSVSTIEASSNAGSATRSIYVSGCYHTSA